MNDLQIIEGKNLDALAGILGASTNTGGGDAGRMPELKINSQVEDDEGNILPRGEFYIKGMDQKVFSPTVKFRPLSHHYQWLHYDPEQNKLVNKTRMVASFREEARDIRGGIKCGKPSYKAMQDMPQEEREKYKDITLFRQVRGLVSYTGKTLSGEEVKIENQPVILMLKGSNYGAFEDDYIKTLTRGQNIFDYYVELSTEKHKNGSVTWYTFVYGKKDGPVAIDQATYDTMVHIADMISTENKKVDDAYFNAAREDALDASAYNALGDSLDDDFDDVA